MQINKNSERINEIHFATENEKEKLTGDKEESSLNDESHDHSHLDKIMKLNFANESEKTNDNIIFKDDKEITNINTETLFNTNYDIFLDKKPKEIFPINDMYNFSNEKVREIPLIKLEKDSLFEKDFTFIFKSSDDKPIVSEKQDTASTNNNIPHQISKNSITPNKENKNNIFQIEQSSNILFENNIFESTKLKKEKDIDFEELKILQKNLLPNNTHQFEEFETDEDDEDNLFSFNMLPPSVHPIREKNIINTNMPQQINMNMRMGMPFNIPQNPNMIPFPVHPMNLMNNYEEYVQNENLYKNQFMKNNAMNLNHCNQMNQMGQMNHMNHMNHMSHTQQNQQMPIINHVFLENPTSIVQKNMYKKGWLLMTLNDKILGQYNSIDLFKYLEKKMTEGWNFENTWVTDYDTDMYFTPSNLYEILKEISPLVMGNLNKNKNSQINFGAMNIKGNMNMNPNINSNMNPNFNPMLFNIPHPINQINPMNMRSINVNNQNNSDVISSQNNSANSNKNARMNTSSNNLLQNSTPNLNRIHEREDNMNPNIINQFQFNLDPRYQNLPINAPSIPIKNIQASPGNPVNSQSLNYGNNTSQFMQPPMNMNINLQFVKNNINLNNILMNNNVNQPASSNVNSNPKTGMGNSINKNMSEKNSSNLSAKDLYRLNNNNIINNDHSIFNSNVFLEKNNVNETNNNRSINQNKRKK